MAESLSDFQYEDEVKETVPAEVAESKAKNESDEEPQESQESQEQQIEDGYVPEPTVPPGFVDLPFADLKRQAKVQPREVLDAATRILTERRALIAARRNRLRDELAQASREQYDCDQRIRIVEIPKTARERAKEKQQFLRERRKRRELQRAKADAVQRRLDDLVARELALESE